MKILLVDDESRKLKKIRSIIRSINGIVEDNVIQALDLNDAKRLLCEFEYDLLIVDINIPEILGEESYEIAGIDFIQEVISVDNYIKPKKIIIVTEYEELLNKYKEIEKEISFRVLVYDETSSYWENILKSEIKYGLIYEKSKKVTNISYDFDVAIITAVDVEMDAVKRLYDNWQLDRKYLDPTFYYVNEFTSNGRRHKIVLAQQSEMGMAAAATLTGKIMHHFKPKYIIMVGIAAAVGDGKNLGDIIVPNEIWNYSSGKYIDSSSGKDKLIDFSPEPKSIPTDPMIAGHATLDFSEILFQIKKSWHENIGHDLRIINGPLACGTAVVANGEVVKELIQEHSRKTVGLDMESYGMYYAVRNGFGNKPTPICFKSVCDFADQEKNNKSQNYAAYTSSSFVKYFIETQLFV